MKKKRFYHHKKRNSKWTEEEKGRKIYFADKYIDSGNGSDKFDNKRKKEKKPVFTKEHMQKWMKYALVGVMGFAIITVGYITMDVYMDRHAMPENSINADGDTGLGNISLDVRSQKIESISLDAGVMLDAVIQEAYSQGFSSVTFDLKRDDGTIGYQSTLATVDMYSALSSPSIDLGNSIATLNENDIMPIGRISCYKDSVVGANDPTCALTIGGAVYRDNADNAYLNPDSESAYNYIKSIIDEANGLGITVFVLENYDLPNELGDAYSDGFENLSNKLYNDLGRNIKLLQGISISITSDDAKEIQAQWESKTQDINGKDIIFSITAADSQKTEQYLNSLSDINYIISK